MSAPRFPAHDELSDELNGVEPRLRFLARSQEPASWGGEAALAELDVEGALAKVLARADGRASAAPAAPRRGWTRALAAALLLVGLGAPWLSSQGAAQPGRDPRAGTLLAGVTTSAVVYAAHSGSAGASKS